MKDRIKTTTISSVLLVLSSLFVMGFSFPGVEKEKGCDAELILISDYYAKASLQRMQYLKCNVQSIENGEEGEKLLTEVWKDGDKVLYKNPFMTVRSDHKHQVVILKDQRLILIQDKPEAGTLSAMPDMQSQIESLKRFTTSIHCGESVKGKNTLTIALPQKTGNRINPISRIVLEYENSGKLTRSTYDFYMKEGSKREVYEYLDIKNSFNKDLLQSSALSYVLAGKKLKEEWQGYTVRDLRNKK